MTKKTNAAGLYGTAAKTAHNDGTTQTRMACPCCGGEVTHQRYGFDVIVVSPLRMMKWYVCDECEAALSGTDDSARRRAEGAFIAHLEGNGYAT